MSTLTVQPATYGRDASMAQFSVTKYQRMIEVGILTPEDKVKLLENYVVLKLPRNPSHEGTLDLIKAALDRLIRSDWLLRVQQTIALPDSQPDPDFAIVRGNPRTYLTRHPGPSDVGLIIEAADSSLLRDQRDKTRIYARAGIPIYWIVNLVDRRIEAHAQPSGPIDVPVYGACDKFELGDVVPLVLDGTPAGSVAVAELLP